MSQRLEDPSYVSGISTPVVCILPKDEKGVQFPYPAPIKRPPCGSFLLRVGKDDSFILTPFRCTLRYMDSYLLSQLVFPGLFCLFMGLLSISHIRHYFLKEGMKFYLLDLFDKKPFYVKKPTKDQRKWLVINIFGSIILFELFAIPIFSLLVQSI